MRRPTLSAALGSLVLAVSVGARAEAGPATSASPSASAAGSAAPTASAPGASLGVHVQPIFGVEAAVGYGWQDFVVTLDNPSSSVARGTVELRSHISTVDREGFAAKAPFSVAPGRTASVRLPMRSHTDQVPQLTLRVVDERGGEIATLPVTPNMAVQPTLIDIDNPSRIAIPLRGRTATVSYSLTPTYSYYSYAPAPAAMTIAVAAPQFDRATGDPILPARAAAYSGVTAVLVKSDTLARLEAEPKDALMDWVAGGGTLAVVVARPEDLRGPELSRLVGSGVEPAEPNPVLFTIPATKPSGSTGGGGGLLPTPSATGTYDEPLRYDFAPKPGDYIPIRTTPTIHAGGPGNALRDKLRGFRGGNVVASNYGVSALYGRGEVHLLAFDPTDTPGVDDGWVQSRVADLVDRAWDRRASLVFPTGANSRSAGYSYYSGTPGHMDEVRRALDPNENFRPALGFAAILLVIYSVFVGPVSFLRAKARGRPLRPLLVAPLLSAAAFGAIVLVGLGVKGWRGRTRHLALAEVGSGATRASVCRFRGFYTSETRSLSIGASDRSSVLDVLSSDSIMDDKAVVRVDRDGFSLENITSLPWQTLVVREHGFSDLQGAITIATGAAPATPSAPPTEVTNATGQTLLDALVYVPGDGVRWFASIKSGEKVDAHAGKLVQSGTARRGVAAGSMTVHAFDPSTIASGLGGKDGDRIVKEWAPITAVAGDAVDWFPDDQIVVLGELEGGERVKWDNGLSVESDRLLVRVVARQ